MNNFSVAKSHIKDSASKEEKKKTVLLTQNRMLEYCLSPYDER